MLMLRKSFDELLGSAGGTTPVEAPAEWDSDLIRDFMDYTSEGLSPEAFRLWSAITLVGGALERRVWAETGDYQTFANLYVLLVAPPGVGKKVIETVRQLWTDVREGVTKNKTFHVAPDSMTKASLIDSLAKAETIKLLPNAPAFTYHSLLVPAAEIGVLMPEYNMEYIGILNQIWDNLELHEETRRTGSVQHVAIERPQLTILGGAQPAWLASTLPDDAWNTGFGRRLLMVYSGEKPVRDIFSKKEKKDELRVKILTKLAKLSQIWGPVTWSAEAFEFFHPIQHGIPPIPTHSKLAVYLNTRTELAIKLAVISAISRACAMRIELADIRRAIAWLTEAEQWMPDIFRAMIGRSDRDVMDELHLFVTAKGSTAKGRQVSGEVIRRFLLERVPHEKVETILAASDRAGLVVRVAGTQDTWLAKPRYNTAPE